MLVIIMQNFSLHKLGKYFSISINNVTIQVILYYVYGYIKIIQYCILIHSHS